MCIKHIYPCILSHNSKYAKYYRIQKHSMIFARLKVTDKIRRHTHNTLLTDSFDNTFYNVMFVFISSASTKYVYYLFGLSFFVNDELSVY